MSTNDEPSTSSGGETQHTKKRKIEGKSKSQFVEQFECESYQRSIEKIARQFGFYNLKIIVQGRYGHL
jgi:hypothetical protein